VLCSVHEMSFAAHVDFPQNYDFISRVPARPCPAREAYACDAPPPLSLSLSSACAPTRP
jgi:hypothetical protein